MYKKNQKLTRMPLLSWVLAFKTVAERGSFTIAARDLHLTQPSISQRITKLESLLKTQLLLRNSKKVELTESGKVLLKQIYQPINELFSILESYNQIQTRKQLIIETEPVWNRVVLTPRLPEFLLDNPEIVLNQTHTTHHLDFSLGTELAIKWGDGYWQDFDAQFLSSLDYLPVCSPEYMHNNNIRQLEDLSRVRILHERDYSDWLYWLKYYPCEHINLNNGHIVGESNILMSLATSGIGVALCGYDLVKEHIESGVLVSPLPDLKVRHYKAYYILTRKNDSLSEHAKNFIKFLHQITLDNIKEQ